MFWELPESLYRKIPILVNIDPITEGRLFVGKILHRSALTFSNSTSSGKFNTAKAYNTSAHCLTSNLSGDRPILNANERIRVTERFFLAPRADNTFRLVINYFLVYTYMIKEIINNIMLINYFDHLWQTNWGY